VKKFEFQLTKQPNICGGAFNVVLLVLQHLEKFKRVLNMCFKFVGSGLDYFNLRN